MKNLYCFTVRLAIQKLAPVRLNAMTVNGINRLQSAKVRNVVFFATTCIHDDLSNVCFTINYRHLPNAERSTKRKSGPEGIPRQTFP